MDNEPEFLLKFVKMDEAGDYYSGVSTEDVIEVLINRLDFLNTKFPCDENIIAITKLNEALEVLNLRTKRRKEQQVEGKMLAHTSVK